jgi:hypothetical protein
LTDELQAALMAVSQLVQNISNNLREAVPGSTAATYKDLIVHNQPALARFITTVSTPLRTGLDDAVSFGQQREES